MRQVLAASIVSRIEASKVGLILSRLRNQNGALDRTVEALLALQKVISATGDVVESIDVNPFLVGEQCIAVDALIVLRR